MSSLIDLAAQATIGSKSGLSETLDSQLKKILETTAEALKEVALDHRQKDDKDVSLSDDGESSMLPLMFGSCKLMRIPNALDWLEA